MMRKPMVLAAILSTLSGCSPSITTDLKLSDVVAVGNTGETYWTSAKLHIPLPEGTDCVGEIAGYVAKLAEIMPASGGRCGTTQNAPHAEIDTSVAIIATEGERPDGAGLVLEVGAFVDASAFYEVTALSRVTLDEINKHLNLSGRAADPEIIFALSNDLDREVGLQFSGVYYNGWATMPDQGILAAGTETSIVRLADVATSVIAAGNGNMFMTVFDLNGPEGASQ